MLIPPCRMQRKASAAVMTKGIMLPVWVSASTDSKSPVPIHATSRSVHSHSIGRAGERNENSIRKDADGGLPLNGQAAVFCAEMEEQ